MKILVVIGILLGIVLSIAALVLLIIYIINLVAKQKTNTGFINLTDVHKLTDGTVRFTFQDVAYQGHIDVVEYIPLGAGAINVTLLSLQPVGQGPAVPDVPLDFTFSLMLAEVTNSPGELIIKAPVPHRGFGQLFFFRVKDK